ncbi:MAG: O-antigen ligase family protein [Ilumatobacteraceae bacterium]
MSQPGTPPPAPPAPATGADASRPATASAATSGGRRTGSRPLGALVSQGIVAGSSLVLSLIALRSLGAAGLGAFSLLFGILTTVNAIQSGWIGDSLTVLDRFDPGYRRALFQSQWATVGLVLLVTAVLGNFVSGVDRDTAVLFGLASVAWVLEETIRRILIARREFWKLAANDASFAVGSLGMLALVAFNGAALSLQTLVMSVMAGAVVAFIVGVIQLPAVELTLGVKAPSRLRELSSFAVWRAIQIGMRPATLSLVRALVAAAASLAALGQLEAARLLLAPILTVINGAGVYLLPTYAAQARRGERFRPTVPRAMIVVAGAAALYGGVAMVLRGQLADLLTDGTTTVSLGAIAAWTLFSMGFGAGVPAGNAVVAEGRSRQTFMIRLIDTAIGLVIAGLCVAAGWIAAVPAGLAVGAFVGAGLLLRSLRVSATRPADAAPLPAAALYEADVEAPPAEPDLWEWHAPATAARPAHPPHRTTTAPRATARAVPVAPPPSDGVWTQRVLWLVPLVLIVATEYKVRKRGIDEVLQGRIDPLIAVELLIYMIVGTWALWHLIPRRPRLQPLMVIMWGYILSTAVSAMYSGFPMLAMARGVQLIIIGAVVHLLTVDGDLRTISRLIHGWIVLLSVSILVGLAYVAPTSNTQRGRFTWLSVHSVSAGSMLALSVPMLFGLWITAGRRRLPWKRWVYGSLFLFNLVFLLLTRTRGSIAGGLVAIGVIAWVSSGRKMKPELALASMVGGGALALAFGGPVLNFLTRGETAEQIGTFNRRTEIWTLAWQAFLDHPVFGLGFSSAKGVFFDETGLGGAHNAAVNVMIDVGLVGLLWWFGLIVAVVFALGRLWGIERRSPVLLAGATSTMRSDLVILLGVVVASLVNSITTEGLGAGVNVSAIWLFIFAAWLTILQRQAATQRALTSSRSAEVPTQSTESSARDPHAATPAVPIPAGHAPR